MKEPEIEAELRLKGIKEAFKERDKEIEALKTEISGLRGFDLTDHVKRIQGLEFKAHLHEEPLLFKKDLDKVVEEKLKPIETKAHVHEESLASKKDLKMLTDDMTKTMNERDERTETLREKYEKRMMAEAVWDTAYINDLPDSAFAYIEEGGTKEEGKTVPRGLRHLPYKDAGGNIDREHLLNALARLPQTNISAEGKESARRKLCHAVGEWNGAHAEDKIESEVCGVAEVKEKAMKYSIHRLPALVEHLQDQIVRKDAEIASLKEDVKTFKDFMETVVKPSIKKIQESANNPPPNLEEERRKQVRKLITGKE